MQVMTLIMRLRLEQASSARLRRATTERILSTIHQHFNVSIADVGHDDEPRQLVLAASCVARTKAQTREILTRVAEALGNYPNAAALSPPEFVSH